MDVKTQGIDKATGHWELVLGGGYGGTGFYQRLLITHHESPRGTCREW